MKKRLLVLTIFVKLFVTNTAVAAEKILDVPYSRQFQAFTCGHESLRMVLGYWGKRESREEILMRIGANGSAPQTVEKVIKTHYPEFRFESIPVEMASIKKQIDLGRPIMLGAEASNLSYLDYDSFSGHMIVLVGYDDAKKLIFIRDPNSPYVEELGYEQLKAAALDNPQAAFVIYKPNTSPAPGPANHFDKAYPPHTKKDTSGIPINWIIPAFYLSYETEPRLNLSDSFAASSKKTSRRYSLSWNGLSFGDQTMEQTPWLGNGKTFQTMGFGGAWVIGSGLRLAPTELLSPGIYSFGRQRILDVHAFTSIKRIPSLMIAKNTVEVSGYLKPENDESLSYETLGVEATSWSGVRVGVRRGVSLMVGHVSAGLTAGKVNIRFDGDNEQVYTTPTLNYDLNAGIIKGSIQIADLPNSNGADEKSHDGLKVRAYSLGMDYDVSNIQINLLPFTILSQMGFFRPHLEMTHEIVRRIKGETHQTATTRRWDLELPVPLHFVDMTYGSGISQTILDEGDRSSLRSSWVRFAFNAYQPWIQVTAGYRINYKSWNEAVSQQISLGMFAGI